MSERAGIVVVYPSVRVVCTMRSNGHVFFPSPSVCLVSGMVCLSVSELMFMPFLFFVSRQDILNEPSEIVGMKGNTIQRKLSVDYISFSAHVDYSQNSEFMELVKPQHIVSGSSLVDVSQGIDMPL